MNIFERTRHRIERHPLSALLLIAAALFPGVLLASYLYVSHWEQTRIIAARQETAAHQQFEEKAIRENIDIEFGAIHTFSWILAHDSRLRAVFTSADPDVLQRANAYLNEFVRGTGLHKAFLLDTNGTCIATDDYQETQSLLGVKLRDRRYFQEAVAGKQAVEFVVGRVTGVPGLHFSCPVSIDNAIVGVAVAKIDTVSLSRHIDFPHGFVTDSNGVIILAQDTSHLFQVMAGTRATKMPDALTHLIYGRTSLEQFELHGTRRYGVDLYRYGTGSSSILNIIDLKDEGLHVYNFSPIAGFDEIRAQFSYRLLVTVSLATLSVLFGLSIGIYLLRDSALHRELLAANAELEHLARFDALTGCYNRRKFEEELHVELHRQRRSGCNLALAILDVDLFKNINDTFGHDGGDVFLRQFVQIIQAQIRDIDLLARIGGEEFAIIFPLIDEDQAYTAMTRLLETVRTTTFTINGQSTVQSFSAGVGSLPPSADSNPRQFRNNVDLALYVAKKCGRNRVITTSSIRNIRDISDVDEAFCSGLV